MPKIVVIAPHTICLSSSVRTPGVSNHPFGRENLDKILLSCSFRVRNVQGQGFFSPAQEIQSDNRNSTEPIGGLDRHLKLARGTNLLKLLISSRGWSKPTDRFHRIPTLGSHPRAFCFQNPE
jgi:hypothetical protein